MREVEIRPTRARALGVITPDIDTLLSAEENNNFVDVRVKRTNGATTSVFQALARKTQNIGSTHLPVSIIIEEVTFTETDDQSQLRIKIYVRNSSNNVHQGVAVLKLYHPALDDPITVNTVTIVDTNDILLSKDQVITNALKNAMRAKNEPIYNIYDLYVEYTDPEQYYYNYNYHVNQVVIYQCYDPLCIVGVTYTPRAVEGVSQPVRIATFSNNSEQFLIEGELEVEQDNTIQFDTYIRDEEGNYVGGVPIEVRIQDTQQEHTIDGVHYSSGQDIAKGSYLPVTKKTSYNSPGTARWTDNISNNFINTLNVVSDRFIFVTLFFPRSDALMRGYDDGAIRNTSGLEARIKLKYLQLMNVTCNDSSTPNDRIFYYGIRVENGKGRAIPNATIICKYKGLNDAGYVTMKDDNGDAITATTDSNGTATFYHYQPKLGEGMKQVQVIVDHEGYKRYTHTYNYTLSKGNYDVFYAESNPPLPNTFNVGDSIIFSFGIMGYFTNANTSTHILEECPHFSLSISTTQGSSGITIEEYTANDSELPSNIYYDPTSAMITVIHTFDRQYSVDVDHYLRLAVEGTSIYNSAIVEEHIIFEVV